MGGNHIRHASGYISKYSGYSCHSHFNISGMGSVPVAIGYLFSEFLPAGPMSLLQASLLVVHVGESGTDYRSELAVLLCIL